MQVNESKPAKRLNHHFHSMKTISVMLAIDKRIRIRYNSITNICSFLKTSKIFNVTIPESSSTNRIENNNLYYNNDFTLTQ